MRYFCLLQPCIRSMDEQKALLKRIVSKIRVLTERFKEQEKALEVEKNEVNRLKLRIRQLEEENKYKNTDKSILNKPLGSGKSLSSQKRADIEKMVREIDHCLTLLEDKKQQ